MKKEFERWFKRQPDSEYCGAHTKALLLECWEASRQSLVVKLPAQPNTGSHPDDYSNGCYSGKESMLDSVRDSLDAAGVRYE